jgi:hypothetical protein
MASTFVLNFNSRPEKKKESYHRTYKREEINQLTINLDVIDNLYTNNMQSPLLAGNSVFYNSDIEKEAYMVGYVWGYWATTSDAVNLNSDMYSNSDIQIWYTIGFNEGFKKSKEHKMVCLPIEKNKHKSVVLYV